MKKDTKLIFSYLIIAFTLFPFLILSFFNLPMGDDFYFGQIGRDNTTIEAVKYWYQNWGGRYSQSFCLSLFNPLTFNKSTLFWIPPLVLILAIIVLFFILIRKVSDKFLTRNEQLTIYAVVIFFFFNFMPEIGETLYWISGAYTFQLGNIFSLLILYLLLLQSRARNSLSKLIIQTSITLLIFINSGFNEVTMLYSIGFFFSLIIYQIFIEKDLKIYSIIFFVAAFFAGLFSYSAPGNELRAEVTGGLFQKVPSALVESIGRGMFYFAVWLPASLLVSMIFWEPLKKLLCHTTINKTISRIPFLIAVILLFAVVTLGFLPSLLSTGWNPPRTVAPIFLTYIVGYAMLLVNYYHKIDSYLSFLDALNRKTLTALGILIILTISGGNNIFKGYNDIFSGKVLKYNQEVQNTYAILNNSQTDTIYVTPLRYIPLTLPVRWPDHYNKLVNDEWGRYFDKVIEMKKAN